MNYSIGQLLHLEDKDVLFELLNFEGEYRRTSEGKRVFKTKPTEDGREHVYYECWNCLNLNTGLVELKKLPVYIFVENEGDYAGTDRRNVIDDSDEVTSLLDHYNCWIEGSRDKKNFHLDIINDRHEEQIARLKQLSDTEQDINLKVGIRLKLIQKEHPNSMTRKMFIRWGNEFPNLLTKLKTYVYKNNDNNNDNNNVTGSIGLQ